MSYVIAVLRLLAIVFGFEILFLLMLASGPSLLAESQTDNSAETLVAWPSQVRNDPTLTPVPTSELPPSAYEAHLLITPTGGINASTYNNDSFILRNKATNEISPLARWMKNFAKKFITSQRFITTFGEDINGKFYAGERSKGGRSGIFKVTAVP